MTTKTVHKDTGILFSVSIALHSVYLSLQSQFLTSLILYLLQKDSAMIIQLNETKRSHTTRRQEFVHLSSEISANRLNPKQVSIVYLLPYRDTNSGARTVDKAQDCICLKWSGENLLTEGTISCWRHLNSLKDLCFVLR